MTDTAAQIADLREKVGRMTGGLSGQWECQPTQKETPDYGVCIVAGNFGGLVGAALPWPTEIDSGDYSRVEADAAGIVALRNTALPIIDAQSAEIEALKAELDEQARVNGMGGEREAALMAERDRLREALRQGAKAVTTQAATLPSYFPEPITALPDMAAIMQGHFDDIAARMTAALTGSAQP